MKTTIGLIGLIGLIGWNCSARTQVEFATMQYVSTQPGGSAQNRQVLVTPLVGPTAGTNLFASGPIKLTPTNGSARAWCEPGPYRVTWDGLSGSLDIVVPDTNVLVTAAQCAIFVPSAANLAFFYTKAQVDSLLSGTNAALLVTLGATNSAILVTLGSTNSALLVTLRATNTALLATLVATNSALLTTLRATNTALLATLAATSNYFTGLLAAPGPVDFSSPFDFGQGVPYRMPANLGHLILMRSDNGGASYFEIARDQSDDFNFNFDSHSLAPDHTYWYRLKTIWGTLGSTAQYTTPSAPADAGAPAVQNNTTDAQVTVPDLPARTSNFAQWQINVDGGGWVSGESSGFWYDVTGWSTNPTDVNTITCPSGESHSIQIRIISHSVLGDTPSSESDFNLSN